MIYPSMESNDYNNVMGIMEMSMQSTLWCDISASLKCLAWDMGELVSNSRQPIWQHAGFTKDYEREKEEASSLMEKITLFTESTQGPQ